MFVHCKITNSRMIISSAVFVYCINSRMIVIVLYLFIVQKNKFKDDCISVISFVVQKKRDKCNISVVFDYCTKIIILKMIAIIVLCYYLFIV